MTEKEEHTEGLQKEEERMRNSRNVTFTKCLYMQTLD